MHLPSGVFPGRIRRLLAIAAAALCLGAVAQPPTDGGHVSDLSGYPWARLRLKGRQVEELPAPSEPTLFSKLQVREHRAFLGQSPRVALQVFGFDSQSEAIAAEQALLEWSDRSGHVHHPRSTLTGGYLLIAGFPSEKPPSPEMEDERTEYLSSFAGEE